MLHMEKSPMGGEDATVNEGVTNELAPGAQISRYAFENLLGSVASSLCQQHKRRISLIFNPRKPEGSLCGSGIEHLKLPSDINFLGPIACENCKQLIFVDLSSTEISAIRGSTFSHCVNLAHIWFPPKLRRIGKEAFMFCNSLREVHTPPALQYIAHRAFFDCGQLTQFRKMSKPTTWRGPYAESNTFALCANFKRPKWIHILPSDGEDSDVFDDERKPCF